MTKRDFGYRQSTGAKPEILAMPAVRIPENCSVCRFFLHNGSYDECRRFPPPYPKTQPVDWCGEFKRKDA
jgi:hypothetical protein